MKLKVTHQRRPPFVYIVGPARSGTTITMFMLCDHPELTVWPQEFPFFTEYNCSLPKNSSVFSFEKLLELVQPRLGEFKETLSRNYYSSMDYSHVDYPLLMASIWKRYKSKITKEEFLRILLESFQESVYPDRDPDRIKYYVVTTKTGGMDWKDSALIDRSFFIFLLRHPWRCYAAYKAKMLAKEKQGDLPPFSYVQTYFYHNLKSLALSSRRQSVNRMKHNFYFLEIEKLKADPRGEMERLAQFLKIEFNESLLQPTCVRRPFQGHFAQADLNTGKVIPMESSYPEPADFEKYVLQSFLKKETLYPYPIRKEKFSLLVFLKKLVFYLQNSIALTTIQKWRHGIWILRGLLKLRFRILLDDLIQ